MTATVAFTVVLPNSLQSVAGVCTIIRNHSRLDQEFKTRVLLPCSASVASFWLVLVICAPADEHRQDDGEPAELENPHDGRVLLGDEDAGGGECRKADADQRRQVLAVCGGAGRSCLSAP